MHPNQRHEKELLNAQLRREHEQDREGIEIAVLGAEKRTGDAGSKDMEGQERGNGQAEGELQPIDEAQPEAAPLEQSPQRQQQMRDQRAIKQHGAERVPP